LLMGNKGHKLGKNSWDNYQTCSIFKNFSPRPI
jgi:hypothetical protein